jgi:hypothetical protein
METIILNIINKKNSNYDNSKVLFSELKKELKCTNEELAIFINGCQDARIDSRVEWDVNF